MFLHIILVNLIKLLNFNNLINFGIFTFYIFDHLKRRFIRNLIFQIVKSLPIERL